MLAGACEHSIAALLEISSSISEILLWDGTQSHIHLESLPGLVDLLCTKHCVSVSNKLEVRTYLSSCYGPEPLTRPREARAWKDIVESRLETWEVSTTFLLLSLTISQLVSGSLVRSSPLILGHKNRNASHAQP